MRFFGIQVKKKHILGAIDGDGFEINITANVASYGYPFHRLSFRVQNQLQGFQTQSRLRKERTFRNCLPLV